MYARKVSRYNVSRMHRVAIALGFSMGALCASVPAIAQEQARSVKRSGATAATAANSAEEVSVRTSSPADVLYALPLSLKAPPARTRRVTPSQTGAPAGEVGRVEAAIETGILRSAKVVVSDRALWEDNGATSSQGAADTATLNNDLSDRGPTSLFARNRVDGDGELRVGPRFIRPRSGTLVSPIKRLRNVYRPR